MIKLLALALVGFVLIAKAGPPCMSVTVQPSSDSCALVGQNPYTYTNGVISIDVGSSCNDVPPVNGAYFWITTSGCAQPCARISRNAANVTAYCFNNGQYYSVTVRMPANCCDLMVYVYGVCNQDGSCGVGVCTDYCRGCSCGS